MNVTIFSYPLFGLGKHSTSYTIQYLDQRSTAMIKIWLVDL